MKKINLFVLTALMIAVNLISYSQVTVTIGTGTDAISLPFKTNYEDAKTDILIKASEIIANGGSSGNILQIGFNISTLDPSIMNGFTVKMKHTPDTVVTAFAAAASLTTVYSSNYNPGATGWQMISLSTPFLWNGTSNLLIEICFDNSTATSSTYVYGSYISPNYKCWYSYSYSGVGCNLTGGYSNSYRPNTRLVIVPATSPYLLSNPSSLAYGYVANGTTSAVLNYNLIGGNLTGFPGNITLTAPANFELSSTGTSGWGATMAVQYNSATLYATPVYVRFKPTANQGYTGIITNVGGGANMNFNVSGTSLIQYCTTGLGGGGCPGDILTVKIIGTTLNNNTHTCSDANNSTYTSYPVTGNTTATLLLGSSYSLNVITSNYSKTSVWIDYNQNGTFESNEWSQISSGNPNDTVLITIPGTANTGITGMRIRSSSYGDSNGATSACTSFWSGMTEDYYVTIATPTVPYLYVMPNSLNFGYNIVGSTSQTLTYNIGGGNLIGFPGNIALTAPANFELSSTGTSGWGGTLNVQYNSASLFPTPVYVRFKPTAYQNYTGNITNIGGSTNININVAGTSLIQYCSTGLGGGGCPGDIETVKIAGTTLYNSTHTCSNENNSTYASYPATGNTTATLNIGSIYSLNVKTSSFKKTSVWIDYNQNGTFESTEWNQISTNDTNATVTIIIPNTATSGVTGMRIRSNYSSSSNGATNACTNFGSGITEDYYITIAVPTAPYLYAIPNSLNFGYNIIGSTSQMLTYNLGGGNLTGFPGNITLTAPANFELSIDGTSGWTGALNVPYSTASLSETLIYVRFKPTAYQDYTGNITIIGGGANFNVNVIGTSLIQYCKTNLGGGNCPGDISSVQISGTTLFNSTHHTCSTANGSTYASYPATGSNTAFLNLLGTYSLNVVTSNTDITSVWIDYNQNGTFETTEWSQISTQATNATVTITIPATATPGLTGMRIRSSYYWDNYNNATSACSYFSYSGMTEDYYVTIAVPTTPYLNAAANSLNFGYNATGTTSSTLTYNINGENLTGFPGNITVTAPANFELSTNGTSGWSGTINVSYSTATLPATLVYVRFKPTANQSYSGNITNIGGGANINVSVTGNSLIQYCSPTYTTGTNAGDYLAGVKLNAINNITLGSSTPFYTYYSLLSADVVIGATDTITLINGNYSGTLAAWIDFNSNGVFEINEKLGESSGVAIGGTINIPFTIPASSISGITRLRVREVYSSTNIDPCVSYDYGETEDYKINLITGQTGYSLTGVVVYNNTANSPLSDITFNLLNGTTQVATAISDISGNFAFTNIVNGVYSLSGSTTKAWGGVTATDALKMKRHIAGLELLTEPIRISAADANNSGNLTATDALKVQRRLAGLDTSFARPDWNFEIPTTGGNSFTIHGFNITQNFYALCTGDVNGSNIPSVMKSANITLNNNLTITANVNEIIELPIRITNASEIGAIQLLLNYPSDLVSILGVSVPNSENEIIYNAKNGQLNIVWSSLNSLQLKENDAIVILKLKANSNTGTIAFELQNESELADAVGNVINGANLNSSVVELNATSIANQSIGKLKLENYPNPFSQNTQIEYQITESGMVNIKVFDILGKEVANLVNTNQPTGKYSVVFNSNSLQQGLYTYTLNVNGKTNNYSLTKTISIIK